MKYKNNSLSMSKPLKLSAKQRAAIARKAKAKALRVLHTGNLNIGDHSYDNRTKPRVNQYS